MRLVQRFISAGFATAALASAAVPTLGWSVWSDIGANVGQPAPAAAAQPASPRWSCVPEAPPDSRR